MTWGSPSYNQAQNDNHCLECLHIADCRAACRAYRPVLCEDGGRRHFAHKTPTSSPCAAALRPGSEFTRRELEAIAGIGTSTAKSWIQRGIRRGNVSIIRNERRGPSKRLAVVYRVAPSTVDCSPPTSTANEPLPVPTKLQGPVPTIQTFRVLETLKVSDGPIKELA